MAEETDTEKSIKCIKILSDFRPVGVTAMKDDGSDLYTVSCDIREKFRRNIRYTIFYYCRGFRESHTCLSDFNWINKNGAILRHTIKVPSGQYGDWMFGVSLVANDYTSGGISFASCYSSVNISCEDASIQKVESLTDL
ncbi:uncharacterized protein LOC133184486 [Saccostrea echinata]|uniref:uncharacterized protein LOC133184486 n=1 Tax=Saccostrea echinata TaxID=191078 RepID=UPI002A8024FC|nr:uncharacterized protein LOC133184486 [Saccostrea echinata]